MAELIFKRTCNYWIDAGIVGLYDTLKKPVPSQKSIGDWNETIQSRSSITTELAEKVLVLGGEERNIDLALSYALEWIRTTLYDVSTEKQIANPEKDGRIKKNSTAIGEVVAKGKQAEGYTYFNQSMTGKVGKKSIFFPVRATQSVDTCVFCGQVINERLKLNEANKLFSGTTEKSSPFLEGLNSNLAFHSFHRGSKKCWQCGYVTFFSPLLMFFRRKFIARDTDDTYYVIPYVPGNLKTTHLLYRSLCGKRGLARVLGSDHTTINYQSAFQRFPSGVPVFTLAFYYDLYDRILPKTGKNLLDAAQEVGLIDERGVVFQSALFSKRDSGQKSFILRETTIDRSAYFIKLFAHLKAKMDIEKKGAKCVDSLRALFNRASGNGPHLQRLAVLKASQAFTEARHVYGFLLPILSSDLRKDEAKPYEVFQIIVLFQIYDQWLFRKGEAPMANVVENAKNAGFYLSQEYWKRAGWDDDEKKNLIKRYYYAIERAPSPVKFLEQARHAYHKVEKEMPKEMVFHDGDGKDDISKFEVYRVYFLAGMLNGMLKSSNVQSPPRS